MSPLQGGSKVRARFRLPGSKRDIEAESRVAWSDRESGWDCSSRRWSRRIRRPSTSSSTSIFSLIGRMTSLFAGRLR
jgi:hypothetical protein